MMWYFLDMFNYFMSRLDCTCNEAKYLRSIFILDYLITDRSKAILLWWFFLFYVLVLKIFVMLAPYVCFHISG